MLLFADTYALVDFVKGNWNYERYLVEHDIITTRLNLLELYYWAMTTESEEKAERCFNSFLPCAVEVEDEILKKAAKFRQKHKKADISFIDAIGYEIANARKIKFLTGDGKFKELPNVEFVK